jgi:hypothetical protein
MSRTALLLASILYVFAALGDGVPISLRVTFICYAVANAALSVMV